MKIANKPFVVLYNGDSLILFVEDNKETLIPKNISYAEFNTRQEAELFINENKLTYEPTNEY